MKRAFLIYSFFLAVLAFGNEAKAHHIGHHHTGVHAGVFWGWGWYPAFTVAPYGYSYYGYWRWLPRYSRFGAIAYSKSTQKVGVSWSYATRGIAQRAAESYCGEADCSSLVWVQGGCAALAKSPENDRVGYGYHTTKHRSWRYAMRGCQQSGADGCRIIAWVCSY